MWADRDSGDVMIAGSWWGFAVVSVTVGFGVAGKTLRRRTVVPAAM
jgi:hypothetical protein